MIELVVHDQAGSPTGEIYSFAESEIARDINRRLVHSAVVMYDANCRLGTAKSKSRAEVAGSSRKLYKQKGTGNARAGNKRTPVRRGGGHCFAKRPKDWRIAMPKKARRLAAKMAILGKMLSGQFFLIDSFGVAVPKTRIAADLICRLGLRGKSGLVAIQDYDESVLKSFRNIPAVRLSLVSDLNAGSVMRSGFLIATKGALNLIRGCSAS